MEKACRAGGIILEAWRHISNISGFNRKRFFLKSRDGSFVPGGKSFLIRFLPVAAVWDVKLKEKGLRITFRLEPRTDFYQ